MKDHKESLILRKPELYKRYLRGKRGHEYSSKEKKKKTRDAWELQKKVRLEEKCANV